MVWYVLVRVDAAGGQPIADPQVVGAAGEGHRRLRAAGRSLLGDQRLLQRLGTSRELEVGVLIGDGDRLPVQVQAGEDVHRHRLIVLRDLAGGDQVRHGRQDMGAVDTVRVRAQPQVIAQRAPRRLLDDLHIRHAVLGEETLLLGDDQRRCIGQRDVAELAPCSPRARTPARRRRPGRRSRCRHEGERGAALVIRRRRVIMVTVRHTIPVWLGCTPN